MEILLAALVLAGIAAVALGVEDHRHWESRKPETLKVETPVMYLDNSFGPRSSLPALVRKSTD